MLSTLKRTAPFLLLFSTTSLSAQAEDELSVSANVGLFSDYRFRGVSLSDEDVALQGGIDLGYKGFYVGTWASTIESFNGSETEVDFYGGYTKTLGGVDWSVGYLAYLYPGADNSNYVEITGAASKDFDVAAFTLGINYAPDQSNIGSSDNVYVYGNVSVPVPNTPISLTGGLAFEDGAFADEKLDWSLGAAVDAYGLTFSAKYIDTNAGDQFGTNADATVVIGIAASF